MVGRDAAEPPGASPESGSGRRAQLLSIAAELFARRGFAATTVREIAESAGILSGSLYHHFESKEAVVDEILRAYLDEQLAAFRKAVGQGGDPRSRLEGLIRASFTVLRRHRWAVAILHNESGYLASLERFAYLEQVNKEFERIWVRVLREGRSRGAFRAELNPRLTHRFIRDSISSVVRWYNPRGRMSAQTIAEQYIRIFCDGVVTTGSA
ncbi:MULTISPECIES: TetR/AcrR family transcriptional regulator [unclassified Actinopolyspora]|uniref:TetR/AcrR family transcriptional regulator n=1 Tax=Actinopolyspora TaxID=1849 RepID=UPI0013F5EDF4|nr:MULTISPECIES: TetR/AcrR family transcriptional regulator [unclassified Actinopolyspora]NHD16920.1 TetR/AcrR family transcriptional regulator [Actinopolyspora sp. BKK2]NHE76072.1 TetR/AcrR family transcriptional regulator [Actinopolyspora sp. BKK1]